MSTINIKLLTLILLSLTGKTLFSQEANLSERKCSYLGQQPPEETPVVFLPGIVSTEEFFEFSCTISPDGDEFYFARRINNNDIPMVVWWEQGVLSQPEVAKYLKAVGGFEPHLSPDGRKLYITRFAPPPMGLKEDKNLSPRDMEAQMVNIWSMEKSDTAWGEPMFCVNGMYVSTSDSGTIYTTDIRSISEGICRYRLVNGRYTDREYLQGGVNFPLPGAHPCIAPDESFIVFDSKRNDDPENADLFVCFRQKDGNWSEAFNLGNAINTCKNEICPSISPDSKYLFYMSKGDIYWVSADIIQKLRPKE
jgi:hypothetical protein